MAQKREGSPIFEDNTKKPMHTDDRYDDSTNKPPRPPPRENSDILKLLLEGQQKMSRDLRANLDKQEIHDRDIERTKSNVFSLGYKLGEVFTQQHDIVDALDFNNHDIQDLRLRVKSTEEMCKTHEVNQNEIKKALMKVNERLDKLERAQLEMSTELRAKSIVISGLKEVQNEDTHQVVFDFVSNIEPTLKFEDIYICYRLGVSQSDNKNSSKNMMVVFMGLGKKQLVMKKKNSLKDNVTHKNTYLNDDLPPET